MFAIIFDIFIIFLRFLQSQRNPLLVMLINYLKHMDFQTRYALIKSFRNGYNGSISDNIMPYSYVQEVDATFLILEPSVPVAAFTGGSVGTADSSSGFAMTPNSIKLFI